MEQFIVNPVYEPVKRPIGRQWFHNIKAAVMRNLKIVLEIIQKICNAGNSKDFLDKSKRICRDELNALISRDKEINRLFERIYEDNATGKISDERFRKLSLKYEEEQKSIEEKVNQLKKSYDEMSDKMGQADFFISAVKKYTCAKKLTPLMLNELIEKIEVFQTEIVDGKRTQKIVIYYNCIGAISIPEDVSIPDAEITLNTRRGVQVSYQPQKAE